MTSVHGLQANCIANTSWVMSLQMEPRMENGARSASEWSLPRIHLAFTSEPSTDTTAHGDSFGVSSASFQLVFRCVQGLIQSFQGLVLNSRANHFAGSSAQTVRTQSLNGDQPES